MLPQGHKLNHFGRGSLNDVIYNKSSKLTQNTPVVFVVNSMVISTFLGAGYSTWRADTANSV